MFRYLERGTLRTSYTREQQAQGGRVRAERAREANQERDDLIRELGKAGVSVRKIAAQVGVGKSTVDRVLQEGKGV